MSAWPTGGISISPVDWDYERSLIPSDLFNGDDDEDFEPEPEKEQEQKIGSIWENTPARPRPSPPSSADHVSSLSNSPDLLYFPSPNPVVRFPVNVSDQELSPSSSSFGNSSSRPPPGFSYAAAAGGNQHTFTQRSTPPIQTPVPVRQHSQLQQQQQKEITPYEKRQQELLHDLMMENLQKQNHQYELFVEHNRQLITQQVLANQYKQYWTNQAILDNHSPPLPADYNNNNNNNVIFYNTTPTPAEAMQQQQMINVVMDMNMNRQQQQAPIMVYGAPPNNSIGKPSMPYHQVHQNPGFNGYRCNGQPQQPQFQPPQGPLYGSPLGPLYGPPQGPQGPPQGLPLGPPLAQEFVSKYRRRRHHIPVPRCQ